MVAVDSTGVAPVFMVAGLPSMDAAESGLTADSAAALQFVEAADSTVLPQHVGAVGSTVEVVPAAAAGPMVGDAGSC